MENPSLISSQGNRSNVQKYRKQVIFMLGAVVVSFFVCLLPFRALTLWIIIVPTEQIESLGIDGYYSILYFCRVMLYLNSAMNPILYNLMSSKFREGFLRLLGCKSMIRSKLGSGTRKGTFHTTSTNLSSSNQHQRSVNGSLRHSKRISISERNERAESLRRSLNTRHSLNHRNSNGISVENQIVKVESDESSTNSSIPYSSTTSTSNDLNIEAAASSIVKCANILFLPSTNPIVEEDNDYGEIEEEDKADTNNEENLLNGTANIIVNEDYTDDNQTVESHANAKIKRNGKSSKNNLSSYQKKENSINYDLLKQDDNPVNGINGKYLHNGNCECASDEQEEIDDENEIIDEEFQYCLSKENIRRAKESLV